MRNYLLKQSEHEIQSAILEVLSCMGVKAWRMNTGRYGVGEGKYRRFIMGAPAGTPDIIGILGRNYKKHFGRMIAIEVKKPGGKTSIIQDRVINEFLDFGAYTFIAYSVDDVQEQLNRLLGREGQW